MNGIAGSWLRDVSDRAIFVNTGGEQQRFSLIELGFVADHGDFLHFWRTGFSSGMGVLVSNVFITSRPFILPMLPF